MKPSVVVVGSYVQDLAWRCAAFPRPGETVIGQFTLGPGGKGSNQAIAAARAGAATRFVGAVGADPFAATARQFYAAEGVGAKFAVKNEHPTGTAAILVNDSGQNEIVVALGANAHLARADVPDAVLRGARVVVGQCESNLATTADVLRRARRLGALTVLNPAPMRGDFAPSLLRHVDVLIPNEGEFAQLLDVMAIAQISERTLAASPVARLATLCRALGVNHVIVTLGSRGCFVCTPTRAIRIAAQRVRVVDTTGAGDAFVGAFAAGYVRSGGDMVGAARFANAAAALSVTKPGTAPAMPQVRDILRLLGSAAASR